MARGYLIWRNIVILRSPLTSIFTHTRNPCDPDLVEPRFCALPDIVMHQLQAKGRRLNAVAADRAVWNRMAA